MIIAIIFFFLTFTIVFACVGLGFRFFKSKQRKKIRSMLEKAEAHPAEQHVSELVRPATVEDRLTKLLRHFHFMDRLTLILEQAGKDWSASKLVTISCITGLAGMIAGAKVRFLIYPEFTSAIFGSIAAAIPLCLVLRKRAKNIAAFEEQLPEALDFLARSMRAGHGFSVGLEMLATDSPDPLGSAFRRVSNDIQLGSSLEVALKKLVGLVPTVDVRFFVSSVVMQQETGGNLGEILTKLAQIIRERFRLKGQVKAVSAHGRITGLVLLLMPAAVTGFIMVSNPQYLRQMSHDGLGRILLYYAVIGQIIGYFIIKKIVNIKV